MILLALAGIAGPTAEQEADRGAALLAGQAEGVVLIFAGEAVAIGAALAQHIDVLSAGQAGWIHPCFQSDCIAEGEVERAVRSGVGYADISAAAGELQAGIVGGEDRIPLLLRTTLAGGHSTGQLALEAGRRDIRAEMDFGLESSIALRKSPPQDGLIGLHLLRIIHGGRCVRPLRRERQCGTGQIQEATCQTGKDAAAGERCHDRAPHENLPKYGEESGEPEAECRLSVRMGVDSLWQTVG